VKRNGVDDLATLLKLSGRALDELGLEMARNRGGEKDGRNREDGQKKSV